MQIHQLFAKQPSSAPVSPNVVVNSQPVALDAKQVGETYTHYGKRLSMSTQGNPDSLSASLQRIFTAEKQAMINDRARQTNHKASLQKKADDADLDIKNIEKENKTLECDVDNAQNEISELDAEIAALKAHEGEENKQAKVKFWIGLGILVILTLYLFIFYSSTFYSAFIHPPKDIETAMFDPQAIPNGFAHGFMSGLFLCTVPVIFLGLGFGLHYISEKKGIGQYIKAGALLIITLMFDMILAVAIAKGLYDNWALTQLTDVPPYQLSMAVEDLHVWAVIFCGFVVYMIWAVVFDLMMTAYGDMRSNAGMVAKLQAAIKSYKSKKEMAQRQLQSNLGQINMLKTQRDQWLAQMSIPSVDINIIANALSQFYQGWTTVIAAVGLDPSIQTKCKAIYDRECQILLQQNSAAVLPASGAVVPTK